jgi:hypothetical protein
MDRKDSHRRRRTSRACGAGLGVALTVGLCVASGGPVAAAPAPPTYLMVSDGAASTVYFYRVPSMTLTGQLTGVKLGSNTAGLPPGVDPAANTPMHGGAIVLPDGRILVNDELHQKTMAIKLDGAGVPSIVNSVDSILGDESPWNAVDPGFRYYAVSSNGGGTVGPPPAPGGFRTGTEFLNLIDLKTFTNTKVEIAMNNTGEDLTPFFGGVPLTLFEVVGGGQIKAFNVASVLAGGTSPTGTFSFGPNAHGGFSSPLTGTIGVTTGPQPPNLGSGASQVPNPDNLGLDVFDLRCTPPNACAPPASAFLGLIPPVPCLGAICPTLVNRTTVPWNADGLSLSKGNRVRMMFDGAHVMTPLNVDLTPGVPTDWQDVRLDAHFTDLRTKSARRINVGTGGSSRGFPVSVTYAVEPVIRPLTPGGTDQLKVIDVRPSSPTYLQVVRSVNIPQMTHGPVAGVTPTYPTYERRFAAITPDGSYAFVTRGGDGVVDVVSTATGAVSSVNVPTSVTGGGHITAFQVGFRPVELSGR